MNDTRLGLKNFYRLEGCDTPKKGIGAQKPACCEDPLNRSQGRAKLTGPCLLTALGCPKRAVALEILGTPMKQWAEGTRPFSDPGEKK